jgi:hypothetical protein
MRLRESDGREFFIMGRSVTATIILPAIQTLDVDLTGYIG